MAVPKRKTTVSKRNKRRSHHRIKDVNIIEDKKSGEYRLSHHIDLKLAFIKAKKSQIFNYIMSKKITIAIDAMGGENAPEKNIAGLDLFIKKK